MRGSHGVCRLMACGALLLLPALMAGCTWGSKNGVPWWGTKKQKEEAAADLEKYGPVAFQRVKIVQDYEKYAAKGSDKEKEQVASRLATDIEHEQDPLVRVQIIRTLGTIPNETATGVLRSGMKDPDPDVRKSVCEAWGKRLSKSKTPDEAGTRLLAETLAGDTNIDVRLAAADALGRAKNNPQAIGALALASKDGDPAMQYRCVASLKQVSGKDFGNDVDKWQQWASTVAPTPGTGPTLATPAPGSPTPGGPTPGTGPQPGGDGSLPSIASGPQLPPR